MARGGQRVPWIALKTQIALKTSVPSEGDKETKRSPGGGQRDKAFPRRGTKGMARLGASGMTVPSGCCYSQPNGDPDL